MNVYFKRIDDYNDKESINNFLYETVKNIIDDEKIKFEGTVPLKVHFGETGNETFIKTENFNGIKKYLKEENINSLYIETNVLYKGSRTNTKDHIDTALKHGFDDLNIVIADDELNDSYTEVEINKKYFKKCKIGAKFKDYDNYIVLAHFKGHGLAFFGGAIKQLGMGFASRGGKLNQHSDSIPVVTDKCVKCMKCIKNCPVNAIRMEDKAVIDKDICIGCAFCSNVCKVNAITNNWDSSNFLEKLAEYAYAASKDKKNIYFNFAFNITNDCDCHGEKMDVVVDNIGVFASTDPVALDTATLDMIQKISESKKFDGGRRTLEYAEEIGLGKMEYTLIIK